MVKNERISAQDLHQLPITEFSYLLKFVLFEINKGFYPLTNKINNVDPEAVLTFGEREALADLHIQANHLHQALNTLNKTQSAQEVVSGGNTHLLWLINRYYLGELNDLAKKWQFFISSTTDREPIPPQPELPQLTVADITTDSKFKPYLYLMANVLMYDINRKYHPGSSPEHRRALEFMIELVEKTEHSGDRGVNQDIHRAVVSSKLWQEFTTQPEVAELFVNLFNSFSSLALILPLTDGEQV